jgi:CheY-like chemotaxis protein
MFMPRVLIIENNPADVDQATAILHKLGISDIHAITSVAFALEYLRDIVEGKKSAPDLVILDLEFGKESGFEVLRFCKSAPQLKDVRIVVWTVMGELEQQMSRLFGVEVVPKHSGVQELQRVIDPLVRGAGA